MIKTLGTTVILALLIGFVVIGTNTKQNTSQPSQSDAVETLTSPDTKTTKDPLVETAEGEVKVPKVTANTTIDVSGQGLTKTPSYIFERTRTQALDLSDNDLDGALPAEIRHLQELLVLNLSDNNFTGIPAEIGQLKKLEILDVSNNQLTGLPYELGNLSNLKILDLRGNEYSDQDLSVIAESLPSSIIIKIN